MLEKAKEHLDHVEETYAEHFAFAATMAFLCFKAGFGILIHAICPAVLQTTGSRTIYQMYDMMHARKEKQKERHGGGA
jgi:hypothetical protein